MPWATRNCTGTTRFSISYCPRDNLKSMSFNISSYFSTSCMAKVDCLEDHLNNRIFHYNDVIMSAMACQITSLTIVYSTVYSGAERRKHQSSVSLAFVRGIHRRPVNSLHKWPVMRKMFPFHDVIMEGFVEACIQQNILYSNLHTLRYTETDIYKTQWVMSVPNRTQQC